VCDDFRAAPLRCRDGELVVDGWTAWPRLAGAHAPRWAEILAVGERLHRALAGEERRVEVLDARTDGWARADRIAWGEQPAGDFAGVPPYWRSARGSAIVVVDAVLWRGADVELLSTVADGQLVVRALLFGQLASRTWPALQLAIAGRSPSPSALRSLRDRAMRETSPVRDATARSLRRRAAPSARSAGLSQHLAAVPRGWPVSLTDSETKTGHPTALSANRVGGHRIRRESARTPSPHCPGCAERPALAESGQRRAERRASRGAASVARSGQRSRRAVSSRGAASGRGEPPIG
jgi:hypothetical protein